MLQTMPMLVIIFTVCLSVRFSSLGSRTWSNGVQSSSLSHVPGGLAGLGGPEDMNIERKSWTMSAATVAVISATHLASENYKVK